MRWTTYWKLRGEDGTLGLTVGGMLIIEDACTGISAQSWHQLGSKRQELGSRKGHKFWGALSWIGLEVPL